MTLRFPSKAEVMQTTGMHKFPLAYLNGGTVSDPCIVLLSNEIPAFGHFPVTKVS